MRNPAMLATHDESNRGLPLTASGLFKAPVPIQSTEKSKPRATIQNCCAALTNLMSRAAWTESKSIRSNNTIAAAVACHFELNRCIMHIHIE